MNYILGVDVGTSSTKTALFDETGKLIADMSCEYELLQPRNGWAEQRPGDWWDAAVWTISGTIAKSGVSADHIVGVGFSGQMHGLVMVDKDGEVIRPAILWCDGRTGKECQTIERLVGRKRLIEITGNPPLTGFTAGKLLWVRDHEPHHASRCRKIMLPKDYVRYRLTGEYGVDPGDASGTNLFDIHTRGWSDEVLSALHIDRAILPPVYESCEVVGRVTQRAAELTGLKAGTPVVCGSGDNACAAVGVGVVTEGLAFTTLGTSGVVYAASEHPLVDPKGRIHTFCSAVPGQYALMSCTLAAGLSLKWFKNTFCGEELSLAEREGVDVYALLDRIAAEVPVGANRLLYLPYLMGERSPILDENSRGVFFGLSAIHTKADLLRAVLEGVVYSQRDCFGIFAELGVKPSKMIACGGGGSSSLWRQMLADNYGCGICTAVNQEGPALGAALMAAVGVGLYKNLPEACQAVIQYRDEQLPQPQNSARYDEFFRVYQTLYPALKESFKSLSEIGCDE